MDDKISPPKWSLVAGVCFLSLSVLFFMALVLVAVLIGKEVPVDSRFLVVVIVSITTAAGSGFLGGYANATGRLSLPFLNTPISFGITGGIAVFFLVMLFGHLLYSGSQNNDKPIEAFHKYREDYREKYEDLHNNLDTATILSDMDSVKKMTYDEYNEFLIQKIRSIDGAHIAIAEIANFYEGLLKCEKNKGVGCKKSDIDRTFGSDISNFWYTYRPYIFEMRKNGYPDIAKLIEQRSSN